MNPVFTVAPASYAARTGAIRLRGSSFGEADVNIKVLRVISDQLPMQVEHWNAERDGTLTEVAVRRKLEAQGYHVSRYVYPPGTCFPDHSHGVDKIDAE